MATPTTGIAPAVHPSGIPYPHPSTPTRAWGPPTTAAAWILASLPLIWLTTRGIGEVLDIAGLPIAALVLGLLALPGYVLAALLLARRDGRQLTMRGYQAPRTAWIMLASPIVYLAVRARRVRDGGGRSTGPVILGSISVGVVTVAVLAIVAVAISGALQAASGRGELYGGFDRYGNPEPGVALTRADAARYVADSEFVRHRISIPVSCGSGALEEMTGFDCSGTDSEGAERRYSVSIAQGYVIAYSPATDREDSGADDGAVSGDGTAPDDAVGSVLVTTVGTDAIGPDGMPLGAEPDTAQLEEFADVNLSRVVGWTVQSCQLADVSSAPVRLTCDALDTSSAHRNIGVEVEDGTGRVRIVDLD